MVKVSSTCDDRRTYDESDVGHGEKRAECEEELRKGGPFPMAMELLNIGVVRGV